MLISFILLTPPKSINSTDPPSAASKIPWTYLLRGNLGRDYI